MKIIIEFARKKINKKKEREENTMFEVNEFLAESDNVLLFSKMAFIKDGEIVIGEVCKVYDDMCLVCNKSNWYRVPQKDLFNIRED